MIDCSTNIWPTTCRANKTHIHAHFKNIRIQMNEAIAYGHTMTQNDSIPWLFYCSPKYENAKFSDKRGHCEMRIALCVRAIFSISFIQDFYCTCLHRIRMRIIKVDLETCNFTKCTPTLLICSAYCLKRKNKTFTDFSLLQKANQIGQWFNISYCLIINGDVEQRFNAIYIITNQRTLKSVEEMYCFVKCIMTAAHSVLIMLYCVWSEIFYREITVAMQCNAMIIEQ